MSDIERLDALEAVALRGYCNTYGKPTSDAERLFVQRGFDAMRFAVAKETEGAVEALGKIAAGPNDAPHSEPWSKAEALVALRAIGGQ